MNKKFNKYTMNSLNEDTVSILQVLSLGSEVKSRVIFFFFFCKLANQEPTIRVKKFECVFSLGP